jgi:hypothetical protein
MPCQIHHSTVNNIKNMTPSVQAKGNIGLVHFLKPPLFMFYFVEGKISIFASIFFFGDVNSKLD